LARADVALYIVDDDPNAANSIAALAWSLGIDCRTFSSAEEFVALAPTLPPGCLMADLRMGGMSGLELQDALAEMRLAFPIIVISGYADVNSTVEAMRRGALTVLEKPCSREAIEKAIESGLEQARSAQKKQQLRTAVVRRFDALSERERQVVQLLLTGEPNKTLARMLNVSMRTVDRLKASVFEKMGVESAVELARIAADLEPAIRPPHFAQHAASRRS